LIFKGEKMKKVILKDVEFKTLNIEQKKEYLCYYFNIVRQVEFGVLSMFAETLSKAIMKYIECENLKNNMFMKMNQEEQEKYIIEHYFMNIRCNPKSWSDDIAEKFLNDPMFELKKEN